MGPHIDVSVAISPEMLTWPGDPGVDVAAWSAIRDGDGANVSELRLGSHTGTHVDAPSHFIDGARTVDELDLDALIGAAFVADLTGVASSIDAADLDAAALPAGTTRLLMKTTNSAMWPSLRAGAFPERYVSLSSEGAAWLVAGGVRLVGADFLSIEAAGAPGHPTHRTLLEAGVVIVEGLDLSAVEPGAYALTCLPLKIAGCDGAPARVVLRPT